MFYSDVILSKRGPLAKVWLAAHAERRLTKTQLIQTDIEETVAAIIGEDVVPMALRLSGQLLLGVTRIYSRKAKFLLDDCSDALMKLKTAFRTGTIDFTTDVPHLSHQHHNNVTLPVTHTMYDFALPDPALEGWDADSSIGAGEGSTSGYIHSNKYTARPEDITLRRYLDTDRRSGSDSMVGWASGDFFDPDGTNAEAIAAATAAASPRQTQRRDSEGRLVDANGDPIAVGEGEDIGDTSSIGIGRDAQMQLGGQRPSLGIPGDLTGFDDFGADDFLLSGMAPADMSGAGGIDLGLDDFDAQRRSVTPVRQTDASLLAKLTPRTVKSVKQAAMQRATAANLTAAKRTRRQQMIDAQTQLDDTTGGRNRRGAQVPAEGIVLVDSTSLPRSAEHVRLMMLQQDPSKAVLPFGVPDAFGRQTFAAARSLAPQLSELFSIDLSYMTRRRAAAQQYEGDERAQKRIRATTAEEGEDDDFASEIGRRHVPDTAAGQADLTIGQSISYDDFGVPFDDVNDDAPGFDLGNMEADTTGTTQMTLRRSQRKRAADESAYRGSDEDLRQRAFHEENALQRLGTPSERSFALGSGDLSPSPSNPLRAFDTVARSDAGGSQSAEQQGAQQAFAVSKNTIRAVKVLQTHLDPEQFGEQASVTVQQITQGATRRAAAAFFFECLALGTKDCLDVTQDQAFGEITIKAKPTMWTSFDEALTA